MKQNTGSQTLSRLYTLLSTLGKDGGVRVIRRWWQRKSARRRRTDGDEVQKGWEGRWIERKCVCVLCVVCMCVCVCYEERILTVPTAGSCCYCPPETLTAIQKTSQLTSPFFWDMAPCHCMIGARRSLTGCSSLTRCECPLDVFLGNETTDDETTALSGKVWPRYTSL